MSRPKPLVIGGDVAGRAMDGSAGERLVVTYHRVVSGRDAARYSAWLAKAAAWARGVR